MIYPDRIFIKRPKEIRQLINGESLSANLGSLPVPRRAGIIPGAQINRFPLPQRTWGCGPRGCDMQVRWVPAFQESCRSHE
jgi:hypothetical protein